VHGNRRNLADTLDLLGMAEWIGTGEAVAAVRDFGRAIDLLRTLDLPHQLSSCLASRCGAAGAATFEPVGTAMWTPAACLCDAEEAIQLAESADWPAGQAYPAFLIGQILTASGAFGRAKAQLDGALALATAIDHRQWLTGTRCALGQLHVLLLTPAAARGHLEAAVTLARDLNSAWWLAYASAYLALAHLQSDDPSGAEAILDAVQPLDALARAGTRTLEERRLAWSWSEVRLAQGRPAEALALADRLLATAPGSGPIPALLTVRGEALLALGREGDAEQALGDAVRGALLRHERPRLGRIHAARAILYCAQGRLDEAGRADDAARAVAEELAATLPVGELRDAYRRRAAAHSPADQARAVPGGAAPRRGDSPLALTMREAEVLRLLAAGRSNRQIAQALFLSSRTVQRHVANLYLKIGAHNKADATAYALRHRLA